MTRVVGNCNRSEFILDPQQALQRGQIVDRMLRLASVPATRGITRAPHRVMNQLDDDRQIEAAAASTPADSMAQDALLDLLRRFQAEGVDYILVGEQAVRLNGRSMASRFAPSISKACSRRRPITATRTGSTAKHWSACSD